MRHEGEYKKFSEMLRYMQDYDNKKFKGLKQSEIVKMQLANINAFEEYNASLENCRTFYDI